MHYGDNSSCHHHLSLPYLMQKKITRITRNEKALKGDASTARWL